MCRMVSYIHIICYSLLQVILKGFCSGSWIVFVLYVCMQPMLVNRSVPFKLHLPPALSPLVCVIPCQSSRVCRVLVKTAS